MKEKECRNAVKGVMKMLSQGLFNTCSGTLARLPLAVCRKAHREESHRHCICSSTPFPFIYFTKINQRLHKIKACISKQIT